MIDELADNVYWVMRKAGGPICVGDVIQDLESSKNTYWTEMWKVNHYDPQLARVLVFGAVMLLAQQGMIARPNQHFKQTHPTVYDYWRVQNLLETLGAAAL